MNKENLKRIENKSSNGQKKGHGFHEWIKKGNSINICTGCPNDCKYCYAKGRAYRFKQVKIGEWSKERIREHDVVKNRKLYDGMIAFPTSHDITITNIDSYLKVLEKLLISGNEILIVSKPRFECIEKICNKAAAYKDKIIFRFSIGAIDDEILSFWDTNAPIYAERKQSLMYAFENGFRTSVSMEPLLDPSNVVTMVEELAEYVSDYIWIGKMNYTGILRKRAHDNNDLHFIEQIKIIEDGQTNEKIWAINDEFQKRPELLKKISWKESFQKVIDLQQQAPVKQTA